MTTYALESTLPAGIFRAYDIRGIVDEQLTPNVIYTIARALADQITQTHQKNVVIARDGRLSGPTLFAALSQGFQDGGCAVVDIGMVPTPVLYFATYHLNIPNGIMLTGSHNPTHYNGIKMLLNGETLSEDKIQQLYQYTQKNNYQQIDAGQSTYRTTCVLEDYLLRITSDIQLKRPLKIVIDSGNGVPGVIAPQLFRSIGCEVVELFTEVDGHFPNHHPDPTVPENLSTLIATVREHQADLGLAFDGDGDRVGVVTNTGTIIWPDKQMMLLSQDVLKRHPGGLIVFDVKCSRDLPAVILENGGEPLMWRTGHSVIKNKMKESQALLAGEMSGHIFFQERWYGFDDGLYAGARLLEIISQQNESTEALFAAFPQSVSTPELKIAIPEKDKLRIMTALKNDPEFADDEKITIDGLRVEFTDGWGLVRCSNTTAHLTLRFEGNSDAALDRIQSVFRKILLNYFIEKDLPF